MTIRSPRERQRAPRHPAAAPTGAASARTGEANTSTNAASAATPAVNPRHVPVPWGSSLETVYNPRGNSMDLIRLVFASAVAVSHALAIGAGWQPILGVTDLGSFAVDGFFVLSGFLITASFLRLHPGRYVWHRFLRIMPAFWACLAVTAFVFAPILAALEGRPAASALTGPEPSWRYITDNFFLYMVNFDVAGMPHGTYQPEVINGALWTLFYEVVCYAMVFGLGIVGALTRRRWMVWAVLGISWVMLLLPAVGFEVRGALFWRFFFIFTLGVLGFLYMRRIPVSKALTVVSLLLVPVSAVLMDDYRIVGGVAFGYLCLMLVAATPFMRMRLRTDLSYGIYVYHWPIETLLVTGGVSALLPMPVFVVVALSLAALMALISWNLLEKRALAAKNFLKAK